MGLAPVPGLVKSQALPGIEDPGGPRQKLQTAAPGLDLRY